jgi:ornithine cyclodeaminase/alanine dehydrogenase
MEKPKISYLNRAQIESLNLNYKQYATCIEKSFTCRGEGKTEMPPKWGLIPTESSLIHAMPASVTGDVNIAGLKWISMYGLNPSRGLPALQGLIVLNDIETGTPQAIMDCGLITEKRTAAAGVTAVKYLAFDDAKTIAIIGLGRVGVQHFIASLELLPQIKHYYLFDFYPPSIENVKKLVGTLPNPPSEITYCSTAEEAVKNADIILTAISMTTEIKPCIKKENLKEKVTFISQDYDAAFTADCFTTADEFIVDDTNQYQATKKRGPNFKDFPMDPNADMGQIMSKKYKLKEGIKRRGVIFLGIATHDIVTAKLIYEKAKELGKGTMLDI